MGRFREMTRQDYIGLGVFLVVAVAWAILWGQYIGEWLNIPKGETRGLIGLFTPFLLLWVFYRGVAARKRQKPS